MLYHYQGCFAILQDRLNKQMFIIIPLVAVSLIIQVFSIIFTLTSHKK